jgi:hypothetical protein
MCVRLMGKRGGRKSRATVPLMTKLETTNLVTLSFSPGDRVRLIH